MATRLQAHRRGGARRTDLAPWQTIIMLGCLNPLASVIGTTGLAAEIADLLVTKLGPWGPFAVLAGVYL